MNQFSADTWIRELKGAPISIICALITAGGVRVSQSYLIRKTGYTDKTISSGLAYLQETGRVNQTTAGWQLSTAFQLALLPVSDSLLDDGRKFSDSIIINNDSLINTEESLNTIITSRKNSDSGTDSDPGVINADSHDITPGDGSSVDEIYLALKLCGIQEPKRSRLARQPGLNAIDVLAWDRRLQKEKGDEYRAGLLIYILERGQEIDRQTREKMESDYATFCFYCGCFYVCECTFDYDDERED